MKRTVRIIRDEKTFKLIFNVGEKEKKSRNKNVNLKFEKII